MPAACGICSEVEGKGGFADARSRADQDQLPGIDTLEKPVKLRKAGVDSQLLVIRNAIPCRLHGLSDAL